MDIGIHRVKFIYAKPKRSGGTTWLTLRVITSDDQEVEITLLGENDTAPTILPGPDDE